MSKRREIERRLHGFGEIKEIMNAMKNLALIETHRLGRLLAAQRRVLASLEAAAADVLAYYPAPVQTDGVDEIRILLGSERGFCGDFNETVTRAAAQTRTAAVALVLVGDKLASRWPPEPRVRARLRGPGTVQEIDTALLALVDTLTTWRSAQPPLHGVRVSVLHHVTDAPEVKLTRLDPFSEWRRAAPRSGYPPLLNVAPPAFLRAFAQHYLYAALHALFYESLMAENRQRMQHMDQAVRRIDEGSRALGLRRRSLRREEITEEIEVIMLNAETLSLAPEDG